jgi:TetR/AcrR family transcriptional repressor of nem operon
MLPLCSQQVIPARAPRTSEARASLSAPGHDKTPLVARTRAEAKAESREALISAGLSLFEESGLDGPSLDAICARAGYTRGAFYVHFPDREAFFVAVMERILAAWVATIVRTADAASDLQRSIHTFLGAVRGEPEHDPMLRTAHTHLYLLLEACRRSPEVKRRFTVLLQAATAQLAEVVSAGQRAGSVRADSDPHALASILVAAVLGTLAMAETGTVPDLDAAEQAVLTLVRG